MKNKKIQILGISAYYHDSAACILNDGKILAAVQEERFTRVKNDASFPRNAIQYCLSTANCEINDIDFIVFYDKPIPTFDRLLLSYLSIAPAGLPSWLRAMPLWLKQKLHLPQIIRKELGYEGEILFSEHHEAHAAAAFYPSPFQEAAILTIDGVGEWATTSYGIGKAEKIDLLNELHFPDSLGLLYSAFTYFTGFRVNSGEYKLMGLAPYGKPIYEDVILDNIVDVKPDGSLRLNMEYFDFLGGLRMTSHKFESLFEGPRREPETKISQREMDIAASIQAVTESVMLKMGFHIFNETGMEKLCLAGGVALNCTAVGRLLREGPFKEIWVQPAAGDAGSALGAALLVWHRLLEKKRNAQDENRPFSPYLGPSYAQDEIKAFLEQKNVPHHLMDAGNRAKIIAEQLAAGKIVGYMAGRMEYGPRALGARSIIADPRGENTKDRINLKIKFRESFRPFAPAVMQEKAYEVFELDRTSPYMTLITHVRDQRNMYPAVTHVDNSSRVQTVATGNKKDFHDVIKAFHEMTGCPIVVNTSFNVRGEPIVCTPDDAYACFMKTGMDTLVMEDTILFKEEQPPLKEKTSEAGASETEIRSIRKSSLTFAASCMVPVAIGLFSHRMLLSLIFGLLACAGLAVAISPVFLKPVYQAAQFAANRIRLALSVLVLTVVFYTIISPVGLFLRLLGKTPIHLRPDAQAKSYWLNHQPADKENLYKRF
ncbi:carbamoyltransferase [Pseudodesulfovibrio senegalensis]|uniref:Carbamoyltransferase n=1 Tax=Pseudodesulfovibrio senegalensis TaxID=1721087 RepID=A0A6N6N134_9BACT|nr:carbamoyltransferase [Pseudodesulfovibrio senegalensis]KAB1441604.1 carbamoyltransferase [Pseudodesulfovibrio senegalensis]